MKKAFFLILILLTACNTFFKKKTEHVLAKVNGDYLYESDLKGIIPPGTPRKDSLILSKNFINNWVRQKAILHYAVKNLPDDNMDFSKQLEDYKNALILYEYENALVKQKLDTLITNEEIQDYYDANQKNFLLKDNIIQIQYVKLNLKSNYVKQFKKLLNSDDQDDKNKLAELCEKQAADYFLDDQNWLYFNDLTKQIPIKTYNQEDFLKNHRQLEYQDSLYLYLVRFKDFKIKESISPLSLEKQRIREIILNKRKIDLISRMQEDIYSKALKNNEVEVY
ncbi:MAG: hypothetical protein PHF97_02525 [Bacteroidales bacterium]|nr:hypothetical protein [Bacteroidales bacterium]